MTAAAIGPRMVSGVLALMAVLGMLALMPAPVSAESPRDLADDLTDDGVYVASIRRDVEEEPLVDAVEDIRFDGLRLVVVVPVDPQPDPKAFARRIQEETAADAAIVFPQDEPLQAYVIDDLSSSMIRSISVARAESDPAQAVRAFARELTVEPVVGRPAIIDRLVSIAVMLVIALGLVVVVEMAIRRIWKQDRASTV